MLAACCTRPQYVVRSYWELGRSRVPGREEVMATTKYSRQLQPRQLAQASYVRLVEVCVVTTDDFLSQTNPIRHVGEIGRELPRASDPVEHTHYRSCNRVKDILLQLLYRTHCYASRLKVSWHYPFPFKLMRVYMAHACHVAKRLETVPHRW